MSAPRAPQGAAALAMILTCVVWSAGCFSCGSSRSVDECYADLVACRKAQVSAWDRSADEPDWIVPAAELKTHPVVGRLGVPLGQVVAIQATIVSGKSTRMLRYDGAYLLCVQFETSLMVLTERGQP